MQTRTLVAWRGSSLVQLVVPHLLLTLKKLSTNTRSFISILLLEIASFFRLIIQWSKTMSGEEFLCVFLRNIFHFHNRYCKAE